MLEGKKIVVLQNTSYHFETGLSVYKSLEDAGADVFIHHLCQERFEQASFLKHLGVKQAQQSDLEEAACGFVVSAYPTPHITIPDVVPMGSHPSMKLFRKRLVYISHRFGRAEDYNKSESPVRPHNCVCLSPLSSRIGVDHFYPIDMPIKPERMSFVSPLQLVVQGHFDHKNRNIPDWVYSLEEKSKKASVIFLGGLSPPKPSSEMKKKGFLCLPNQSELSFYKLLNGHTHFIFAMIDRTIKNGTYLRERFSSNFNIAFALEKPLVCHEDFKEIYGAPGLYYNDDNMKEVIERLFGMNQADYDSMVAEFEVAKKPRREHNNRVLTDKVEAVCG